MRTPYKVDALEELVSLFNEFRTLVPQLVPFFDPEGEEGQFLFEAAGLSKGITKMRKTLDGAKRIDPKEFDKYIGLASALISLGEEPRLSLEFQRLAFPLVDRVAYQQYEKFGQVVTRGNVGVVKKVFMPKTVLILIFCLLLPWTIGSYSTGHVIYSAARLSATRRAGENGLVCVGICGLRSLAKTDGRTAAWL